MGSCTDIDGDSFKPSNNAFQKSAETSSAVDPDIHQHFRVIHLLQKNNDLFYIGGFIAKKMVAKMKSIECANELYHSFCQEHAIKSKTTLPSCSPINDNVFVSSS